MRISIFPAAKLMIDNTKVVFLSFIILFALIIPIIPTGIPTSKIMPLPPMPIISSSLNKELEFRMFVGVLDHQTTKGITKHIASSNPKIILSNTVLFSFIYNHTPLVKFLFISLFYRQFRICITKAHRAKPIPLILLCIICHNTNG